MTKERAEEVFAAWAARIETGEAADFAVVVAAHPELGEQVLCNVGFGKRHRSIPQGCIQLFTKGPHDIVYGLGNLFLLQGALGVLQH